MRLIPLFRPNTTIHRIMQINKSQPKDKYNQASWISYNTNYTDEKYAEFGHGCMISIALDAGSSNLFSGIRVLIVAEEVDSLHNTVLKDCFESTKKYNITPSQQPSTYKKALSDARNDARNQQLIKTTQASDALPLCPVIFQLVEITYVASYVALVPRQSILSHERLRILYERIEPCTPTQHSLSVLIDSSHAFTPLFGQPAPPTITLRPSETLPVHHYVDVILISDHRRPFRPLPRSVLDRIVIFTFEDKHVGWRRNLLAIGLVCKAWSEVLELFFYDFSVHADYDKPNLNAVISSLRMRPERAKLIQRFEYRTYGYGPRSAGDQEIGHSERCLCHTIITLLELTTSVKTVSVPIFHTSVIPAAIDALSQLREMTHFCVDGLREFHMRVPEKRFTMSEMQRSVANSENLEDFQASCWEEEITDSLQAPSFRCKVKMLELTSGRLSGLQLLHFASSRLRKLHLWQVAGLTNSNLLTFLVEASEGLESLMIDLINVPTKPEDEEYALDAAMPHMINLSYAEIYGNIASALAITRKPTLPNLRLPQAKAQGEISLLNVSSSVIGIDEILVIAEVASWALVTLRLDEASGRAWDTYSRNRGAGIAKERGVELRCDVTFVDYSDSESD